MPELFDLRVKARSLAYLFATGALLGLLTLALPHGEAVRDAQMVVLAGIALVVAGLLFVSASRIREWQLHLVVVAGTLIITLANYYVGTSALYPLFYSWTVLYAFYFFSMRVALVHLATVGLSYAVLLAIQDGVSPVVSWLLAVGTPALIGLLISRLVARMGREEQAREERQRELRDSEARTRLVLDTSPDAYLTVDRDGIIVAWNQAAERLFGWGAGEAIGKPMRSLIVPPEFRERTDRRRQAMIAAEGAVSTQIFDSEYVRRDGSRFPGEATVAKVVVGDDVLISGFLHDVSERRRRQQEREELSASRPRGRRPSGWRRW